MSDTPHFDRRAEFADRTWFAQNLGTYTRIRPATQAELLSRRLPMVTVRKTGDGRLVYQFGESADADAPR